MRRTTVTIILLAMLAVFVPRLAFADEPQRPTITALMTNTELEERGDLAKLRKDYRGAIDYYRAAIKKDRNNGSLYNKVGLCYLLMLDHRAAQSEFEKAAKRRPNDPVIFNNIAATAYFLKNYGKAIKYYKNALALDETNATFHSNLATAWFAQKQFERAMIEYQRALELDPEVLIRSERGGFSAQIRPEDRAYYAFLIAKLYAKRGDVEHCLEALKKAKEEGYPKLLDVYKAEEFAGVRQDARIGELIPPPPPKL